MRSPSRWSPGNNRPTTPLIILTLVASMVVGAVLAAQAIVAARERRAISEAMLRQYAQLAAWEFSRQARRDIEQALNQALAVYAHPERARRGGEQCGCGLTGAAEEFFEVSGSGEITTKSAVVRAAVSGLVALASFPEGSPMDSGLLRTLPVPGDASRFIALKAEPHLASGPGQVGMVAKVASLEPMLSRIYARATLLPAVLAGKRDARTLVDFKVTDGAGAILFSSRDTAVGPYIVESPVLGDLAVSLIAHASMTPAFISALGPAHGAAPRTTLVVTLVAVNALLMIVGLWQLKRERELARLRNDFVAGVSHELRTPLAQIRMFSETLLLERVRSDEERRRALEIIGQESKRLGQLVDNVLHFHGRGRVLHDNAGEPIDLKAFVHDVLSSFEPLAASKNVDLAFAFTADDLDVHGDAGALRQVLLNLLDNAVKFGPSGQTITVRVAREGNAASVTVDDAGPGVPLNDRGRIFEAFERGRGTNGSGGAGIGLSVCTPNRDRASRSRDRRGRANRRRPLPNRPAGMNSVANILVVEDNKDLAYGLRNNLEIDGHVVDTVETGEEALTRVRRLAPDLVVLDLMLPNLDGYQVLRRLRADGHDMPVLILTARTEEADKVLGFRLGADDYVTKPFGVLELLARVGALIRRSVRSSPPKRPSRGLAISKSTATPGSWRAAAIASI